MKIFISHIHQEKRLANELKDWLESSFAGRCSVFVSSSEDDIGPGAQWLNAVKANLDGANVVIALISPFSIHRPWINFESGCGWIKDIPIVPVCHSDFPVSALPIPLSLFQALSLDNEDSCIRLVGLVAKFLEIDRSKLPRIDYKQMREALASAAKPQLALYGAHPLDALRAMAHSVNRPLFDQIGNRIKHYSSAPLLSNNSCAVTIRDHDNPHLLINESLLSYRVHRDHIHSERVVLPLRYRQRYAFPKIATPSISEWVSRLSIKIGNVQFGSADAEIETINEGETTHLIIKVERDVPLTEDVNITINTEFLTSKDRPYEVMRVRYPSNGFKASVTYKTSCIFDCAWFKLRDPRSPDEHGGDVQYTNNGIFATTNDWLLPGEGVTIFYHDADL